MYDKIIIKITAILITISMLSACQTVKKVGDIGPKHLEVYTISQDDFLASNRMLVVLNEKGDVAAFSGGTVSGGGTVGLQTSASLISSGAIIYGATALKHGLENVKAVTTVKGIPNKADINVTVDSPLVKN